MADAAALNTRASESGYCAPDSVDISADGAGAWTVTSTHYSLDAETTRIDAIEMGRMLEAAFPAFQAYFGATPPLAPGERLRVKVFATPQNFIEALKAMGVTADGAGYYGPATKMAYLGVQGNPYYTHVLLLHEAAHQFHYLARIKGRKPPTWYVEGLAEYLSRHDWDTKCLRLGTMSMLSWEDLPGKAVTEATTSGIDVPAIVKETVTPSRGLAWALYRFLDTTHPTEFKAYRDAEDADVTGPDQPFTRLVADPASLKEPLLSWLAGAQEPMKPVFVEWVHVGPGAVIGGSPRSISVAVMRAPATHFEARYDVPTSSGWSVGTVLSYQDNRNYMALVVDSTGSLKTLRARNGSSRFYDEGTAPASLDGKTGSIAVDFTATSAQVTLNGAHSQYDLRLPATGGLFVSGGLVAFHDISAW